MIIQWLGLPALGAGLALGAVRLIGTGWLKSLFDKDLEDFKSKQQQKLEEYKADQLAKIEAFKANQSGKIEHLKGDISASLNRIGKLHDFEFKVLPEIWHLLHVAGGSCGTVSSRGRRRIDVSNMPMDAYEEALDTFKFTPVDKSRLKLFVGADRQNEFSKGCDYLEISAARNDFNQFNNYLLSHGIFIPTYLRDRFKEFRELIADAVSEAEYSYQYPTAMVGPESWDARTKFAKNWPSMISAFEDEVQNRLWDRHNDPDDTDNVDPK